MNKKAEQIIGQYRRHANAFINQRGTGLMEESWLERFFGMALLAGKSPRILDIGCGFGEPIARYLSARGGLVTGVDSAPALLQEAKLRAPASEWIEADMRELDLGRRFEGVLAWNSFFHLGHDEQRKMFSIFRAHAAKGAALMFTSGTEHGEAMGEFEGEALYHASLSETEYRRLLSENNFEVIAHVKEDPDCGQHTVWLARCIG